MFRIILSCVSHLWDLLFESFSPTTHSHTPSSSSSESTASTTDPQTASSSTTPTTQYDVFLSFRGEDTRLNFTGHLYQRLHDHGIKTFKDDPELRRGEVISDALLDAIRKSKTYIVVLSENYASSSWCLDELAEILNCHKTMERSVIPVFYNTEPSVVRRLTGSFEQALKKHQVRFADEMEKVNNWKLTLTEVAGFSGYHVTKDRSEADYISKIVDELLVKINPKTLDVAKHPVGLDSRVEAITALLSRDTKGVIKFGIYGMGGVGKTTLAKALFNQLVSGGRFKGSCFLADVRENSRTAKGLVSLQMQLINDVLRSTKKVEVHNVDEGIKLIEARICSTKVVVVIDDLDDLKQLRSLVGPFASESVVIITTRDEEILIKTEVETRYRYMVNTLDEADSLALFMRHAFGDDEPNSTLMKLSKYILRLAGGLPLALEVFGSYLYKRSELGWKSYIKKLQRDPDSSIQQRLVISLDALESDDQNLKKIFLDIACCFIAWKKERVVEILGTYYSYADDYIDNLEKRCLLTINSKEELQMHDLLREVGRKIARNNSPEEPGKHSRLWLQEEIFDVLRKDKGTEAIECIIPDNLFHQYVQTLLLSWTETFETETFETKTFKRMSKLRFLYLRNVNLTGSFEQIFQDLRWFCWHGCQLKCLPSEFNPPNLVILELPNCKMRTMVVTKLPSLETLDLHGCESLEEVDISIGSLMRLVSINLHGCEKLRSLPKTICNLRALEVLDISECDSLEELPMQLGNIISLTKLNAGGLTISKLPDSIGHLSKLVELDISYNKKLETLPDTICNLRSLEILSVYGCEKLEILPDELWKCSLEYLDLSWSGITALPSGFSQLSNLLYLYLYDCPNLFSIPKLPPNLKWIDASDCESLERLPNLSNLKLLEYLDLSHCSGLTEIQGLEELTALRSLNAGGTTLLKKLPDIGSSEIALSLEYLDLSYGGITALPSGFSQLSNLLSLDIRSCSITALPSGFSQLSNLIYLYLIECPNLFSIPKLPPNLKRIYAHKCKSLERLPNLSNLKLLEDLHLSYCSGLTEIQGLEELTALKMLNSSGCNGLTYVRTLRLPYKRITKQLFQLYIEYGHPIKDFGKDFDEGSKGLYSKFEEASDWMMESPYWTSGSDSTTLNACLLPNESHNFMGIIVCFEDRRDDKLISYSVKNTTTGFIWSGSLLISFSAWSFSRKQAESLMVIVPKSIFPITDDDREIEFTADVNIAGIHLLYKTETKMIDDVVKKHVFDIDALKLDDPVLQDIFLDISCFFIDWEKQDAVRILETYYPDVNHYIDILKNRCLLNINDEDKLEMDDLLQHIGRKTAQNNSPDEPGKHSRLWLSIDIYDVLKKQKGTEAIECISSRQHDYKDALEEESFTTETFKRMSKLRFLYLKNVNLTGSFEQIFEYLRWLCWYECPLELLPSDFCPQKLVILSMPHSQLRTMWKPNMVLDKLKTLNMFHSLDLKTTPDFTNLPCLETLCFDYCNSLEEVHISIGGLVRLSSLNLHDCVSLKTLPDTICNLRALRCLDIGGCSSLEALPTEFRNFEYLFKARELSASKLPNLSDFKHLEELHLSFCSGSTKIQGLEELTTIRRLYLEGCTSSLAHNLSKRLFQTYSGLGHHIEISAPEFPDWIGLAADWNSESPNTHSQIFLVMSPWTCQCFEDGFRMSLKLPPKVSHKFLGMILCYEGSNNYHAYVINYSVKNTTTGFIWRGYFNKKSNSLLMVIVPKSVFPIKEGEEIELTSSYAINCKIYLLYQSENDSNTVEVEEERSNPSLSNLESKMNRLSLGSSSTTAMNVDEEGSYPSKRLKHSE